MKKYLLIIAISSLPLYPLLQNGLPITHDGIDHVARIANFYRALSEGVIFPRWAELLNWGYGHPILMFLYPFSSYTASFFHFLGFSYIDSLKIIFGLGYIASGVTMYLWAKEQFDENIGLAASFLYLFGPYRFVDLYVRGAIGEHMAFIFPPLVLYFVLKFFKSKGVWSQYLYFCGIGTSFALLLLSHNAISLMFVPVFLLYSLLLFYKKKERKKLIFVGAGFVVGLLLSSFFIFPAFFEGKYTLRDIVTGEEYMTRFVSSPLKFLYGEWNYGITGQFTVQLGIVHILGIILLPLVLFRRKIKPEIKVLLSVFAGILLISLFLQLSISNFLYDVFTTLKKFQFPWRFLSLSLFASSVIAASALFLIKKEKRVWGVVVVVICLIATTFVFWRANGYLIRQDSFFEKVYHGTTDTGESAPIWSVRFMEKFPSEHIEVISGDAEIDMISRTTNQHLYKITVNSVDARIRENTLYFPGWEVLVDNNKTPIQFQDPTERGLITFHLSQGEHNVSVEFHDTKLRFFSNFLSIAAFVILMVAGGLIFFFRKK